MTKAWADALAKGDTVFSPRFGIPVEADWRRFPEVVPFLVEATRSGASPEWGPHLVFADDGALVGNGGWKGPPVDGRVGCPSKNRVPVRAARQARFRRGAATN